MIHSQQTPAMPCPCREEAPLRKEATSLLQTMVKNAAGWQTRLKREAALLLPSLLVALTIFFCTTLFLVQLANHGW